MAWTLITIRSLVRTLTGEKSTSQWSNDDVDTAINEFYQDTFPHEIALPELWDWATWSVNTAEDGDYDIAETTLKLRAPWTLDDGDGDAVAELSWTYNRPAFFETYPEDDSRDEGIPGAVLIYGPKIYIRPKADAAYTIKAAAYEKPALLTVSVNPVSDRWGPAIAYGTAIQRLNDRGDYEETTGLAGLYQYHLNNVNRKTLARLSGVRSVPRF